MFYNVPVLPELPQSTALATLSVVLCPLCDFSQPSQRNTCLVKKCPVHKQCVVGLGELTGKESKETANLRWSEVRILHHDLRSITEKREK